MRGVKEWRGKESNSVKRWALHVGGYQREYFVARSQYECMR